MPHAEYARVEHSAISPRRISAETSPQDASAVAFSVPATFTPPFAQNVQVKHANVQVKTAFLQLLHANVCVKHVFLHAKRH